MFFKVVIFRKKYPSADLISMVRTVVSLEWDLAHNVDQVTLNGEMYGPAIPVQDLAEQAESGK